MKKKKKKKKKESSITKERNTSGIRAKYFRKAHILARFSSLGYCETFLFLSATADLFVFPLYLVTRNFFHYTLKFLNFVDVVSSHILYNLSPPSSPPPPHTLRLSQPSNFRPTTAHFSTTAFSKTAHDFPESNITRFGGALVQRCRNSTK